MLGNADGVNTDFLDDLIRPLTGFHM